MKSKASSIHDKRMRKYKKKIGPIKAWFLRRKGKKDVCNGLIRPKPGDESIPVSMFLEKENETYGQVASAAWELTHEFNKKLFKDLEKAIKMQRQYEKELETIVSKEPKPLNEAQLGLRKKGEEKLSDDQIASRRQKEEKKRTSSYRANKAAAEQKAKENVEKIKEMGSEVIEENTSCRLFCSVARHHYEQRRAAYWEGVLMKLPENEAASAIPPTIPRKEDDAERLYTAAHESIMEEALRRIERYRTLVSAETSTDKKDAREV